MLLVTGNGNSIFFWTTPWSPSGQLINFVGHNGPRHYGIPLSSSLASLWVGDSWEIRPARSQEMEQVQVFMSTVTFVDHEDTPEWGNVVPAVGCLCSIDFLLVIGYCLGAYRQILSVFCAIYSQRAETTFSFAARSPLESGEPLLRSFALPLLPTTGKDNLWPHPVHRRQTPAIPYNSNLADSDPRAMARAQQQASPFSLQIAGSYSLNHLFHHKKSPICVP